MCNEPLENYFGLSGSPSPFDMVNTSLYRGYIGTWVIADNRLYLIALKVPTGEYKYGYDYVYVHCKYKYRCGYVYGEKEICQKVPLSTIFPGFPDRVFAHWFSGTIRIPQGELIKYVHAGYGSVYERDLLLDVERGVIVATRVRHNPAAEPDTPEEELM